MKASKINLYELIGLIIGDGSILYNYRNKWHRLQISGDVNQDKEYFDHLSNFIYKIANKKPTISKRKLILHGISNGYKLELNLYHKRFVDYLVHELKLDYGDKTFTVRIPKRFLIWKYAKHVLRGLFESDGSLYFSKSKITINHPSYPRIEMRTVSYRLAKQIYHILKKRKFNVQFMETRYHDFKIYLSGPAMLNKWIKEIGFSNQNSITKYLLWKKLGYYLPNITFEQRKKLLKT